VMGPDEFHMMVNNNCYTNVMAKKCFDYTASVLKEMAKKAPKEYSALVKRVKLDKSEALDFVAKAKKMRVPYDPAT